MNAIQPNNKKTPSEYQDQPESSLVKNLTEVTGIDFNRPPDSPDSSSSTSNSTISSSSGSAATTAAAAAATAATAAAAAAGTPLIPYTLGALSSFESDSYEDIKYEPLIIRFRAGRYANQSINLGSNIQEFSTEQSANWGDKKGQKQRIGYEFNSISGRDFNFTIEFYDPNEDIAPLVENLSHLQEINPSTNEPDLVDLIIGKTKYEYAFCTKFSAKYSYPLPESRGFRQATVQLGFKVGGGQGSLQQPAIPFTQTPLGEAIANLSQQELAQQRVESDRNRLIDCLLEEGEDEAYEELLKNFEEDPKTINNLPDNLFLQVSVGGLPTGITSDPAYQERLKRILVPEVARFYVPTPFAETYAELILTNGDITTIPDGEGRKIDPAYQDIYNRILEGNASESVAAEHTAVLTAIAPCGRKLARDGGLNIAAEEAKLEDSWVLANFNQLLEDNEKRRISDLELRTLLRLPGKSEGKEILERIKQKKVYESKEDFVAHLQDLGFNPYSSWAAVSDQDKKILGDINKYLADIVPEVNQNVKKGSKEIAKRFTANKKGWTGGVGSTKFKTNIAQQLAGEEFTTKEEFIKRLYELKTKGNKPYDRAEALEYGNKFWLGFGRNAPKTNDSLQ